MRRAFGRFSANIDERIASEMKVSRLAAFQVNSTQLPSYRFVDLHRAIEERFDAERTAVIVDSEHTYTTLNDILYGRFSPPQSGRIQRPNNKAWQVGPDEEEFLPVDRFWLFPAPDPSGRLVVRLNFQPYTETALLEVAAEDGAASERWLNGIVERSAQLSVYRNKVLALAYEPGKKDEYGEIERPENFQILFRADEPMPDEDIVIDDDIREMLWRNVIDLHEKRDLLKAHRVPVRRGVLLYGPPGTGKTFACRYICGKLPKTTRIIVAGKALFHVNAIFSLARLLQPSLVILEDVDLVFASREINLYGSVLGEMLDQMDGLRSNEDVNFILTTNAIDRMEAAIRDRPGRISQCIQFDAPPARLRKRYLLRYLSGYEADGLDADKLVTQSEGATQAFLKEWVHRAVQIALERPGGGDQTLALENDDFSRAMTEMKKFSEGSTGRIIGFHAGS